MKKILKLAFPHTIPVLAGFIFLGMAFGLLLQTKGYPFYYPIFMSAIIYSGSLEFAVIPLMSLPLNPLETFLMGLMISARHLFYGIPMLKKYAKAKALRFPLIYTLADETFSINSTIEVPKDVDSTKFYATISLLNYSYWQLGTILGAIFGEIVTFDTTGIDFSLTALFIVLLIEQVKTKEGKISGIIGVVSTLVVLLLFGKENMVVISMIVVLLLLLVLKKVITHE